MIINVRSCLSRTGIIVSRLVENEERTGYASFVAEKFLIKDKIEALKIIKKILISSRKLPEITADDFVFTINKISKKLTCSTTLKQLVKTINDESMTSEMATLSHVFFNNKPLQQIKAINIINGNMYFMIKAGANYRLELIEKEKIKCIMTINSLVNLYRQIKHGTKVPLKKLKQSAANFNKFVLSTSENEIIVNTIEPETPNAGILERELPREDISYFYDNNSENFTTTSPVQTTEQIGERLARNRLAVTLPEYTIQTPERIEEKLARYLFTETSPENTTQTPEQLESLQSTEQWRSLQQPRLERRLTSNGLSEVSAEDDD